MTIRLQESICTNYIHIVKYKSRKMTITSDWRNRNICSMFYSNENYTNTRDTTTQIKNRNEKLSTKYPQLESDVCYKSNGLVAFAECEMKIELLL